MNAPTGEKAPTKEKKLFFGGFLAKLRKRHSFETLAAFIAGGWLILEFVDRLLVAHYHFPDETIDLTFITILAALICTILWRWFRGTEKRPGNVKVEVLLVPLIILTALCIDLNILLDIAGISGKRLLTGIIALCLGIAWIIFKALQWAATSPALTPKSGKRGVEISLPVPVKTERSIVVLPFKNISPEEGQDYFCDGMTEELITKLSKVLSLRVISRTSAFIFKDTSKNVRDIAQELNVGYVLEGSVRKAGNKLRIAAQLIDGTTDAHLWADHYDGVLEDVFDIQDSVSQSIVEMLKIKLTNEEKQRIDERPISNVAAYEYYLRAYSEIVSGTEQTLGRAVRYLQNALDIIGDNALILSYMAFAYWMYVNIGARQEEYLTKAEEYVKRSLAIDPALGKTHVVLGWIRLFTPGGKFETGIRHFKKGLELSPEETWALQGIADIYIFSGKISTAIPICEKLLKLDPLDFHTNWIHAVLPLYDGRYDEAVRRWLKLYEMFPEYPMAQFYTALALAYNKYIDQAFAVIDKSASLNPDNVVVKLGLMLKYAIQKDKERAYQEMNPEFRKTSQRDGGYCHNLAGIFAILKEKTEALDWLENAVDRGFINYPLLAEKDLFLANIRSEPRFKKLMERVKYEWEHFEV